MSLVASRMVNPFHKVPAQRNHYLWQLWPYEVYAVLCCGQWLSRVQLFVTPWTVACQAPLSMEFSRQEYWSGSPCPPPEVEDPEMEARFPALQEDALPSEPAGKL